jgi:hypothetical protein
LLYLKLNFNVKTNFHNEIKFQCKTNFHNKYLVIFETVYFYRFDFNKMLIFVDSRHTTHYLQWHFISIWQFSRSILPVRPDEELMIYSSTGRLWLRFVLIKCFSKHIFKYVKKSINNVMDNIFSERKGVLRDYCIGFFLCSLGHLLRIPSKPTCTLMTYFLMYYGSSLIHHLTPIFVIKAISSCFHLPYKHGHIDWLIYSPDSTKSTILISCCIYKLCK